MISVEGLSKRFTQRRGKQVEVVAAVSDVHFTAQDARITGLLGPNGAGKTTSLRIVAGLIDADAGRVHVDGLDIVQSRRQALGRLGILSDARGLYPRLSARENILYYARLHGMSDSDANARIHWLNKVLEMDGLLERRTEGFSQGERMKTALARAIVHDPPNIILDEPTNGLDVLSTRRLRAALRRLRDEEGKCIVFSTHIMQEVERLCDQVVLVSHGRTVATGTPAELCAQSGEPDFEEAFVKLAFTSQERSAA
ncbi:MAG TPA: ATP-binding cassette domain-containing protein [Pseudomonadota bacterium]|nr:ATP-binding cassette domain-containing protein [Pseudomonadota bacterium]